MGPTHDDLVRRAERWLRNSRGCSVVLTEFTSSLPETPDAIGWRITEAWSIVVECKTTRSDFRADQDKAPRLPGAPGVGQERWYLTRPGLIRQDELPSGWGLLECHDRQLRVVVPCARARYAGVSTLANLDKDTARQELSLALSALRRHHCRACFREINQREQETLGT